MARYYAKLLAYKDEYEVARLHTDGAFEQKIDGMFEGDYKLVYHLAPPLLAHNRSRSPASRARCASAPGCWRCSACLQRLKGLRGTALDLFGHTDERRTERALIREYEQTVERLLAELTPQNHALAVQIASLPEEIRGFGHIKKRNVEAARKKRHELLQRFSARGVERAAA